MCNVSEAIWRRAMTKGLEEGKLQGIAEGKILGAMKIYRDMGMNRDEIIGNITRKFSITADEAERYLAQATAEA